MKHDHKVGDIWYRYTASHNMYIEDRLPFPNEFVVVKVSDHCVWIQPTHHKWKEPKKLFAGSGASFAKPTLQLAIESFVYRSKRAIQHHTRKIEDARATLVYAERMKAEFLHHPKQLGYEARNHFGEDH